MGDPACFLDAICLTCGRFLDSDELEGPTTCPHCGAELDDRQNAFPSGKVSPPGQRKG